ncbi:hypothetical protein HAX54_014883 [Datura stramonium]|uniref:Uncharacterized protein n=1 Tax=Datura stramonium TaxID=4076 RepID=A0ABS8Y2F2_DATST|nr:hypothetical protein [Datura stramonium]
MGRRPVRLHSPNMGMSPSSLARSSNGHASSGPRTLAAWTCPLTFLAFCRHGHAPNSLRMRPAWACAQRPSPAVVMGMRPASVGRGRHGHVPRDPRTRPAWTCPSVSLALGGHGYAPSGPHTCPTWACPPSLSVIILPNDMSRARPASPRHGQGRHAAGMGRCPVALALAKHRHEPNVPRARQPWACAHSPRTRPAWTCPLKSLA